LGYWNVCCAFSDPAKNDLGDSAAQMRRMFPAIFSRHFFPAIFSRENGSWLVCTKPSAGFRSSKFAREVVWWELF
jgi:hypothetical protein